jgi:hypothetical protein
VDTQGLRRPAVEANLDGSSTENFAVPCDETTLLRLLRETFPNPRLDAERRSYVDTPDWSRLEPWMSMRERFAGIPREAPPADTERPRTH